MAFHAKSDAGFKNCIGCIDGVLDWFDVPTKAGCDEAECGQKKF